jgi:DNA polymerase-1
METKMTTRILVDADSIIFAAAAASETVIDWEDDIYSVHADLKIAKEVLTDKLDAIEWTTGKGRFILCLSCSTRHYFRHDLYPEYKSNRAKTFGRPPISFGHLKNWVKENYEVREYPNLEADDVVGIGGTIFKDTIIVGSDKDLRQIPGRHVDPLHLDRGIETVTEDEALYNLWYQVLTGDSVDGYPGCPKIGKVKAEKLLGSVSAAQRPIVAWEAYQKAAQTFEEFRTQYYVARILHSANYDLKEKRVLYDDFSQSDFE